MHFSSILKTPATIFRGMTTKGKGKYLYTHCKNLPPFLSTTAYPEQIKQAAVPFPAKQTFQ